jgi:beta-glucosidase
LEQLSPPEAIATANGILQDSMQVHFPAESRLSQPSQSQPLRNVVIVDDALACDFLGRYTPAIALPQTKGYQLQLIDSHTPTIPFEAHPTIIQPTLLQLFIRGNPFRGSAGLTQTAQDWFQFLLKTDQLQALVIYGSPYAVEQFIPQLSADVPYVFTYGQMPAAQAIALDALFNPQA